MANPFLGEIRAFGFQYAPVGWLMCNGQLLAINQYAALFSLLGTTYGGNGVQTFALPDLRGRVAVHVGGTGGYVQGTSTGQENVSLNTAQLPMHPHNINAAISTTANRASSPGPTVILGSGSTSVGGNTAASIYAGGASNVQLAPLAVNGGGQPHENRMPSLVMNYCIAMSGIFPTRG